MGTTILLNKSRESKVSDCCDHRGPQRDHRWGVVASSVILLILGSSLFACSHRRLRSKVNVVVITLDTLRTDVLGVYGNSEELSPKLDHFARRSFVFEHAVSAIGTTLPSHTTIFTGLYPKHHGVWWNGGHLNRGIDTLAEILRANGYTTAAFVSVMRMLRHGGLDRGFETYGDRTSRRRQRIQSARRVLTETLNWLKRNQDQPFFLWVHFYLMHSPYPLTPYAKDQFSARDYSGALAKGTTVHGFYSLERVISNNATASWAARVLYKGELVKLDGDVGAILARLTGPKLRGHTLIVIAADHGQELGEHGTVGHSFLLWQPVLHVPLIVHLPGESTGQKIPDRVGLVDLTPTILDYLHLPIPPHLDGRSLIPALQGRKLAPRIYFGDVCKPERRHKRHGRRRDGRQAGGLAAYEGEVKAIWMPTSYRVFDLTRDPSELGGAGDAVNPATKSALFKAIEEFHAEKPFYSKSKPLGPNLKKQLESLGYTG